MLKLLAELRKKVDIGFVGGSDFVKIPEQSSVDGQPGQPSELHKLSNHLLIRPSCFTAIDKFDYAFAENGPTAYKLGKRFPSQSFIGNDGEDKYKGLVNFILHRIANLDIPIKR
jgi:phosphomannomutase